MIEDYKIICLVQKNNFHFISFEKWWQSACHSHSDLIIFLWLQKDHVQCERSAHNRNETRCKGRDRGGFLCSYCSEMVDWQLLSDIVIQRMTAECLFETVCMYKKCSNLHLNSALPLENEIYFEEPSCLLKGRIAFRTAFEFARKQGIILNNSPLKQLV